MIGIISAAFSAALALSAGYGMALFSFHFIVGVIWQQRKERWANWLWQYSRYLFFPCFIYRLQVGFPRSLRDRWAIIATKIGVGNEWRNFEGIFFRPLCSMPSRAGWYPPTPLASELYRNKEVG